MLQVVTILAFSSGWVAMFQARVFRPDLDRQHSGCMPAPAQFPLFMKSSGPFSTMNKLKLLMSLMGCLIISGCSLNPARTAVGPHAQSLIAQDMVNVLAQTVELPPASTTLNFPSQQSADDAFSSILIEKFKDAGYAVRTAGISPGESAVSHVVTQDTDLQHGAIDTYTVTVGSISVRRAYITIDDQQVRPLAAMQIKGTSAVGLQLDNQIFQNQQALASPRDAVTNPRDAAAPEASLPSSASAGLAARPLSPSATAGLEPLAQDKIEELPLNLEESFDPSLLNIVAPTTYRVTEQGAELNALRDLSRAPTRNVRELGESNFAEAFSRLAIVKEVILTFNNDSVRMGPVNKARVSDLVGLFNVSTDVFSVIGCSNGTTSLAIGQQGLALGRAERVREELLFAGVPSENILKEGCWAGEAYDERMPRRGVVLSLKRRPA